MRNTNYSSPTIKPNNPSIANLHPTIKQFYTEFGIKQSSSFSGGFRFIEKEKKEKQIVKEDKNISKQQLYELFGIEKKNNFIDLYKIDNEYVPENKSQLADKLMQKIEHQMKKAKYYREKYNQIQ